MSTLSLDDIKEAHEEFWRWVFSTRDGPGHPVKITNGSADRTFNRILILAGALSGDAQRKIRPLQIPDGNVDYIFVPADNCVYTRADRDGNNDRELIDKANIDMTTGKGSVWINDHIQEVNLLPGHEFDLNIQYCIENTGNSKRGEGCQNGTPPRETRAAAACHYALIDTRSLKRRDIIKILGETNSSINVTYMVV
ncbi:MAG TPA: hypothetical protein VJ551_00205 [Nitrososphaeraceae archaeon]|nr:hypothetical protein [Nitrososphaeraceae archaeon]